MGVASHVWLCWSSQLEELAPLTQIDRHPPPPSSSKSTPPRFIQVDRPPPPVPPRLATGITNPDHGHLNRCDRAREGAGVYWWLLPRLFCWLLLTDAALAALGASLHFVLSHLRSHEKVFTSISTIYEPTSPLDAPVIILLENNGIRLRFDGPDQRLRLIEVLDFQKCAPTYNGRDLVRIGAGAGAGGPTFKSIYHKTFGPTYPGEYVEARSLYVLSYPGVAFTFPVDSKAWKEDVDFATLLSSAHAQPASSMAIFSGDSWADARDHLFTRPASAPRLPTVSGANARLSPANDEVELVRIRDGNSIEVVRRHNPPFCIALHATTPQDLIAELGPPNVIYRKSDHRLSIHRRPGGGHHRHHHHHHHHPHDTDDTEEDTPSTDDESDLSDMGAAPASDCFYNYFSHGFDVFVSADRSPSHPVATKVIIHGNVPGSYEFQRYRRCRWTIDLAPSVRTQAGLATDSETPFPQMLVQLRHRFGAGQKPMPLNRGSDSPSSSCELLGGWDEADASALKHDGGPETAFGNTGALPSPAPAARRQTLTLTG